MDRIAQVRDQITARQKEDLKQAAMVKEAEVQSIMMAVHAAAGNERGVKAAAGWRLYAPEDGAPVQADVPSVRELSELFPVGAGATGLIGDEELNAEISRQLAEVGHV